MRLFHRECLLAHASTRTDRRVCQVLASHLHLAFRHFRDADVGAAWVVSQIQIVVNLRCIPMYSTVLHRMAGTSSTSSCKLPESSQLKNNGNTYTRLCTMSVKKVVLRCTRRSSVRAILDGVLLMASSSKSSSS